MPVKEDYDPCRGFLILMDVDAAALAEFAAGDRSLDAGPAGCCGLRSYIYGRANGTAAFWNTTILIGGNAGAEKGEERECSGESHEAVSGALMFQPWQIPVLKCNFTTVVSNIHNKILYCLLR